MWNPIEIIIVLVVLYINTSIDCENSDFCTSSSLRTSLTIFNIGPKVYIKSNHLKFKQRHSHLWYFDQINSQFNELNVKDLFKGKFVEVSNALGLTKLDCVSKCTKISDLVIAIGYSDNKTDSDGNREFIYSLFKPQSDGTYKPTDDLPEWGLKTNGHFSPIPDAFWDKNMAYIREILDFIFFSNTILIRFITIDYRIISIMKQIYTNGTISDKWTAFEDYAPARGKSTFQLDQWFYNVMEGNIDSYIVNRFIYRTIGIVSGQTLYEMAIDGGFNMTYTSKFFNCSEASNDSTSISWSSETEPNMYTTNESELELGQTEPPKPRFGFVFLIVFSLISIVILVVGLIYFIVKKFTSDETQDEETDDIIVKQNVLKPNQKAIQRNKTTITSTSIEPKLEKNTKLAKTRENQ